MYMRNKQLLAEACGWYGAIALIGAYALASFAIIQADGIIFQLLNFTGAIGIIVIASYKKVRQSVLLNVFWAAIALVAMARILM